MKKTLLVLLVVIVAGAVTLFAVKGQDSYDSTKYSATLSDGFKNGSLITYTLPDQFDKPHTLDDSIDKLMVVFAKDTGHSVKEFLKKKPADYLKKHKTAFIADVSPMPVIIRNTFALPDLKKQPYSVHLIYDKKISDDFKKDADTDSIAIINLKNRKIVGVSYIKASDDIQKSLAF